MCFIFYVVVDMVALIVMLRMMERAPLDVSERQDGSNFE